MPKGIYYFDIPPWLDDARILMLEPCCILKSPPLIKHFLLFLVKFAHQKKGIETFTQTIFLVSKKSALRAEKKAGIFPYL